jgi:hypothetical protein
VRWLVVAMVAGCYSPHPQPGAPCANGTCPDGLVCSQATQTCELTAIDAPAAPQDAAPDVAVDAPMIDAPLPTAQLVQQNVNYAALGQQVSVVLANLPQAGDVLVFVGGCPQNNLDSVSGGGVTTWTRGAFSRVNANVEIWYGVTDGTSATVTAKLSTCVGPIQGHASEWSGLTATPSDGGHATAGTTSPADPGAVTTTHARDLLIFGVADDAPNTFGNPAPGTWTALEAPSGMYIMQGEWFEVVPAAGTYDPHVSETAHSWDAALVALQIAP